MKTILSTDKAPLAIGPYSQGINTGNLLFLSGQLPICPEKGEIVATDIEGQTRQSLENVKAILASAGCTMDDVVKTTVFLQDIADFAKMNGVYAEFFNEGNYPARSAFQVAALPKEALVEIEVVALKAEQQKAMNKAVRLTRELIRIDSTNPGAGEQNVAEFIKDYLAIPGIVITEDEVSDKRNNLVAEIETEQFGTEVPRLVLICHIDTVVAGKGWNRDPFGAEQEEGRIYGRGACDMKSGLACALAVFKETAQAVEQGTIRLMRPIRLICTVDEEGDMNGVECAVRLHRVHK